jgi:hypothetical protein
VLAPRRLAAMKLLRCWLYQCSEGEVPETALFKAFAELSNTLAQVVVSELAEYEAAPWGAL